MAPGSTPFPPLTSLTETTRKQIGKYRVVGQLGRGGMAEVFLVMAGEHETISKLLVIKRVLDEHLIDPEFIGMFLDEARIALRFSHQNVVQTFEVDSEERVPFLTMEYLAGQPLNKLMLLERSHGVVMPLAMKLHLAIGWLQGLHHAHTLRDYNGRPLQVVHRDISPHNLFVTYEGVAKVVDFGIAKAVGRLQKTHSSAGGPKGKARYMAPEQASNGEVDARADLFAFGIVLAELLSGRRFWPSGTNDMNVLIALVHDQIPSFEPPPGLPPDLFAIVSRAIASDPEHRFCSAEAFLTALEACAKRHELLATSAELGAWMKRLFQRDQEHLQGQIYQALARQSGAVPELPEGRLTPTVAALPSMTRTQTSPTRRRWRIGGGLGLGLLLGAAALHALPVGPAPAVAQVSATSDTSTHATASESSSAAPSSVPPTASPSASLTLSSATAPRAPVVLKAPSKPAPAAPARTGKQPPPLFLQ